MDEQTARCAETLARLIRMETVSSPDTSGNAKFHAFRELLKDVFPALFGLAEYTEFPDGFVLRWKGRDPSLQPDLYMNHHDVVEAGGEWRHGPFSGDIADGRLWGRVKPRNAVPEFLLSAVRLHHRVPPGLEQIVDQCFRFLLAHVGGYPVHHVFGIRQLE